MEDTLIPSPSVQQKAAALYGHVKLHHSQGWCCISVWDPDERTYLTQGIGATWQDALIDAARYETAELAYA